MQHPSPNRRHRSAIEVRQLLARFRQSGLTQIQFARNEGLSLSTLHRYLKRHRNLAADPSPAPRRAPQVEFLEVHPTGPLHFHTAAPPTPAHFAPQAASYRLALAGGSILEIPTGFCPEEAQLLLRLAVNITSR